MKKKFFTSLHSVLWRLFFSIFLLASLLPFLTISIFYLLILNSYSYSLYSHYFNFEISFVSHRDDVQSMDASSWNLLAYMWKNNNSISVLASFHSLSRNNRRKVNTDAAEIEFADFDDPRRCKVLPLLALDKTAITQLVARMLRTSSLKPAQVRTKGVSFIRIFLYFNVFQCFFNVFLMFFNVFLIIYSWQRII